MAILFFIGCAILFFVIHNEEKRRKKELPLPLVIEVVSDAWSFGMGCVIWTLLALVFAFFVGAPVVAVLEGVAP